MCVCVCVCVIVLLCVYVCVRACVRMRMCVGPCVCVCSECLHPAVITAPLSVYLCFILDDVRRTRVTNATTPRAGLVHVR